LGEALKFGFAPDQPVRLEQGVLMGDVSGGLLGDGGEVVQGISGCAYP
jgi:hypothetical protein